MTPDQRLALILSALGVVFIPLLGLLFRITIKWTRIEARLDAIANELIELVKDKDKTHNEMLQQMREDRDATNRRLRWLEENVWRRRGNAPSKNTP